MGPATLRRGLEIKSAIKRKGVTSARETPYCFVAGMLSLEFATYGVTGWSSHHTEATLGSPEWDLIQSGFT